jgi:hypothetical protein
MELFPSSISQTDSKQEAIMLGLVILPYVVDIFFCSILCRNVPKL